MKSQTWLHECVLAEAETLCGTDTHRDRITLLRRTKHEGQSFLTITLPAFAKDFERSLELGRVDSSGFHSFRKSGAIPAFLRGMTSRVFDPVSGVLLPDPCVDTIAWIRQFCLVYKKVQLPCSEKRVRAALTQYRVTDQALADHFCYVPTREIDLFRFVAGVLWCGVTSRLTLKLLSHSLVPRHGPGATAERISGNQKFLLKRWHTRLDALFPFDMYGLTSPDKFLEEGEHQHVESVEPDAEQPVRVVTVPKTLGTPRVIAVEPVCTQYIQQAISNELVSLLERDKLVSGHINFRDQTVNRSLAQDSSGSRQLATIDLSEASDRVHQDLVRTMFDHAPLVRRAVFACRSARASLDDGTTISLSKFASMGSSLCFPVEAMVFFTICLVARMRQENTRWTAARVKALAARYYVYGDDIIAPAGEVPAISETMAIFGLKVNAHKTFWTGKFRESCGMDAYDGWDVTPAYCRRELPRDGHCHPEVLSLVSFANQLYTRGWWKAAKTVREAAEELVGKLPHVLATSPGLGWTSYLGTFSPGRWNSELSCWETRTLVPVSPRVPDRLDGHGALLKFLLKPGNQPSDEGHLERSVRPYSVRTKRRWVQPY